MFTSQSSTAPDRRSPGLREASFTELAMDLCRLGPAPTRSRELFVIVVTAVLLAVLFGVFAPGVPVLLGVMLAVLGYLAVRWTVGVRSTWRNR